MDKREISPHGQGKNQLDELARLMKRAEESVSDHKPYHTAFQIDNFILGPAAIGPHDSDTAALGYYVQAQREIRSRISAIYSTKSLLCSLNLEVAQQEGALNKRRLFETSRTRKLARAVAMAEIDRLLYEIEQTEASILDTYRELRQFLEVLALYEKRVRAWSCEKRASVEKDQWVLKFERSLRASFLCNTTDSTTIHTLLDMPERARDSLMEHSAESPTVLAVLESIKEISDASYDRGNTITGTHQHLSALEASV